MLAKIGLIMIATGGAKYTQFVAPLVKSVKKYAPEMETILFSDEIIAAPDYLFQQEGLGWPRATLMRYHMMLKHNAFLEKFNYLFYCDVDMLFVNRVTPDEIISNGITATLHPGFPNSFERNPISTAFVKEKYNHTYYQGCFQGGETKAFLRMCGSIAYNIDQDDKKGHIAVWHDESHLNRYLIDNPPEKVLTPAYCYPDDKYLVHPESWKTVDFIPKIVHLEKLDQGSWKNVR